METTRQVIQHNLLTSWFMINFSYTAFSCIFVDIKYLVIKFLLRSCTSPLASITIIYWKFSISLWAFIWHTIDQLWEYSMRYYQILQGRVTILYQCFQKACNFKPKVEEGFVALRDIVLMHCKLYKSCLYFICFII